MLSRRSFLRLTMTLGGGVLLRPLLRSDSLPTLTAKAGGSVPDLDITLKAEVKSVQILPSGGPTTVWQYTATRNAGSPDALTTIPGSYLGPIIRMTRGEHFRATFFNQLPGTEETSVHWHGMHVPDTMDGHPRHVIKPGETYTYEFTVLNRAGSYWFHPHPHGRTGPQVYNGLAGLFIVSDSEEQAAGLPSGAYDIPLVIQDRTFDANNQLVYSADTDGFFGDTILVNGFPNANMNVEARSYRLRIYNGSNARIYKIAWEDGTPLTVIGSDGGLLETPLTYDYVTLGPAERVELLVNFGKWSGKTIKLRSLAFSGATPAFNNNSTLPNGAKFDIISFTVGTNPTPTPAPYNVYLPLVQRQGRLSTIERYDVNDAVNASSPRTFTLYRTRGQWTISGRTFELTATAPDERVQLNTLELWEFANVVPAGVRGINNSAHPMHIHGPLFQVVERIPPTDATQRANWETVKDGYVDSGWKDTILLMPGERVRLLIKFHDYTGLYLYHCHLLEHEDMGMMRNYLVQ